MAMSKPTSLDLPAEYPPEKRTVGQVLRHASQCLTDKPLLIDIEGDTLTYREADRRADQIAHGLAQLGIEHQEPVLFMLPDGIDLVVLFLGLARRGAIEVPINLSYRGAFLSRIINDSCARTLIIAGNFLERLEQICDELTDLRRCVIYPAPPDDLSPRLEKKFEIVGFDTLLSDNDTPYESELRLSDLVGIMYTSGTTGVSKGVMVCHAQAYRYAHNVSGNHGLVPRDRFYTSGLPLFHIAGQWGVVYGSMIRGATAVLRRGYRNAYFWQDIREYGCTVAIMIGAIANFLWQQAAREDDADNPLERVCVYPVMTEYKAFAKRFGVSLSTAYGSSETPAPCKHPMGEPFPTNQCVGFIKDTVDCKILDEHDTPCPTGVVGEICIRPHNPWEITLGYWNNPEQTVKAFRNLWFHTGDAGYIDEQNRLYFVDRLTDSMRRRGENISSMEVEDVVNQHPCVLECAVFPVTADESEQEVMVSVSPQPGSVVDPVDLVKFCNLRMPYFMVPRYIDILENIPKTPTGKMQKFKLRQQGVTESTWDRVQAGIKLER